MATALEAAQRSVESAGDRPITDIWTFEFATLKRFALTWIDMQLLVLAYHHLLRSVSRIWGKEDFGRMADEASGHANEGAVRALAKVAVGRARQQLALTSVGDASAAELELRHGRADRGLALWRGEGAESGCGKQDGSSNGVCGLEHDGALSRVGEIRGLRWKRASRRSAVMLTTPTFVDKPIQLVNTFP